MSFAKLFKEIYTPVLDSMGFKVKRNIYHKLVNDKVILLLSFIKYGQNFTIQFDFWPLCYGHDIEVFMDSIYSLQTIYPELDDWPCDVEKCEAHLFDSLEYCKKSVFKYFEKITDYQSCFECRSELDRLEECMKKNLYEIPNLCLQSYHFLFLALGKYDLALKAKEANIRQNKRAMDSYARNRGIDICEYPYYEEIMEKVKYYNKIKTFIENNDFDSINKIIIQNEQHSKESYEKNFLGKKYSQ